MDFEIILFFALKNMTNDGRKGLVISYNVLNLPSEVTSSASGSLTHTYLSDGTKVAAIKSDGSGERYIGSFVYSVPASGSEVLESAAWDEGRINFTKSGSSYTKSDLWFVKDHVGNVRIVVDVSTGLSAPQVLERNDYLPFGTRMDAGTAVLTTNRFRLGGKENQTFGSLDLGKVDFGARMFDPFTAGWTTADPLAAKYLNISTHGFCLDNPVNMVDPQGDTVRVYIETQQFGHTWISIGEGMSMVVYSYGRYDGTNKGNQLSNGPGVLLRLPGEEALKYNKDKSLIGYHSYSITDVNEEKVSNILNSMFNSSEVLPSKKKDGNYYLYPSAHVIDEYKLLSNNCTTTVSDILNIAGSQVLRGDVFQPTGCFGIYTYSTVPTIHRFVNPRSLYNHLNKINNLPSKYVKK